MDQQPLFLESINDVLDAIVRAAGGAKAVAAQLRPRMPVDDARRWLLDCLNADRPHKFEYHDIVALFRIGREVGFHQGKHWLDCETGYVPSDPADPEVEKEKLIAVIERTTQELHRAVDVLDRLRDRKPIVRAA